MRELLRAEAHFTAGGGFVGAHYFIHRWKGHHIPDAPELRRQAVQRLMASNMAQAYEVDGKTALRSLTGDEDDLGEDAEPTREVVRVAHVDEDETVEMRLSDAMKTIRRRIAHENRPETPTKKGK